MIIAIIFCLGLCVSLVIIAGMLFKGRWIRLIAGYTFKSKVELETVAVGRIARYVGVACLAASLVMLSILFVVL